MSPKKKISTGTMLPPKSGVKVRMYNTGFGDCFLLAFPCEGAGVFYMLIDCGVHHRFPDGALQMQKVARNIASATANHLDVVVVTHEHTDHILGFKHAQDVFDQITIDNLWLAWTENPDDPLAKALKEQYGQQVAALTSAIQKLGATAPAFAMSIQSVLEFEPRAILGASEKKLDELDFLRTKSRKKLRRPKDYRSPGEPPLALSGVKGVKVFVLGPPKDQNLIRMLEKKSELYLEMMAMDENSAFAVAALMAGEAGTTQEDDLRWFVRNRPFDASFGIPKTEIESHPEYKDFYIGAYGFSDQSDHGAAWRRIDNDWLAVAEQLALSLNSKTNNTSLVLAIELNGQDVLLFAADAQVGNWLSWQDLTWPTEGLGGKTIRGKDLLENTVLYKVGHHGSRNATLSLRGLEMMSQPDMVAMLPVNEKWAKETMSWDHPADGVLTRLEEKTRGRIIRMDKIPTENTPPNKPAKLSDEEWNEFVQNLAWDHSADHLWIEYVIGSA
jgi:beta-lactamase superfamily II metal-dependent hydrolase